MDKVISILNSFSEYPGLRHCSVSDDSGEEFYHKILNHEFKRALDNKIKLKVDIDHTAGFAPSFLDEAFGNLVYDFTLNVVKNNLSIISNQEPYWKEMIENETFMEWEERRITNKAPKITENHNPWYRLLDGEFKKKVWLEPK